MGVRVMGDRGHGRPRSWATPVIGDRRHARRFFFFFFLFLFLFFFFLADRGDAGYW